ncbi:prokaryotic type I DNA topoisomerase [Aulographum hederae CBS 113979]|uniref:DNA topoisomerase n=1 Tax=Aulographum hederae CBS 113979 TaxID=1176131 RepID=A0A6G1GWV6_9PEZI|nr:prokaryotic type I DNA topoisomerase [Aulographum hederae CBS 113979]
MVQILCVAEKPSIAKAVANHLAGQVTTTSARGIAWIKNYEFNFNFNAWGHSSVCFTSVAGHVYEKDFESRFRDWQGCSPQALFDAPIVTTVANNDKKAIVRNIEEKARSASILYIWTDCDREGEHIGTEIREIAMKTNRRIQVVRARFSNIERAHIINAAHHPFALDERQAAAVQARMELDLRLGAAFTRLQTLNLKPIIKHLLTEEKSVISYGSCQFPALGFVVDRYFRVKNFIPEPFWGLRLSHTKDDIKVKFNWSRNHLFDRMVTTILFERCLTARTATVTSVQTKATSKWKPLPLTTVELQKMGSKYLRMDSHRVMTIAEQLYTKGWISYPRTETDQFDPAMDLRTLVTRQTQDPNWGLFAQNLINGGFNQPRSGRNNDKAHPPIHPVNYVVGTSLTEEERRVYEFVVRRFLACCSEDAKGSQTTIHLLFGSEIFSATGLIVLARNYLVVYPYDRWESSQVLPPFIHGETLVPTELRMEEGQTTPPGFLTEPELISLMDANGIGTDATMAEHIAKIKKRNYVMTQPRGRNGGGGRGGTGNADAPAREGQGGTGVQEFIPTTLGVALIEGYDKLEFEKSLSKPFLRKEFELQMRAICEGRSTKNDVVHQELEQYQEVFVKTSQQMGVLKAVRLFPFTTFRSCIRNSAMDSCVSDHLIEYRYRTREC